MLWYLIVLMDIESHHLRVTKISSLDGAVLDKANVVVDPFAVNSSTVLSEISKLAATSPMKDPNTLSPF